MIAGSCCAEREWTTRILEGSQVSCDHIVVAHFSVPAQNWVWQPTYVNPPNIHLPETWGYLQFSTGRSLVLAFVSVIYFSDPVNSTKLVRDAEWPVRVALMQTYYALTKVWIYVFDCSSLTVM